VLRTAFSLKKYKNKNFVDENEILLQNFRQTLEFPQAVSAEIFFSTLDSPCTAVDGSDWLRLIPVAASDRSFVRALRQRFDTR